VRFPISLILIDQTNFPLGALDKIRHSCDAPPRIARVVDTFGSGVTDHEILARMDKATAIATQDAKLHNTALREGLLSFCWFQNALWQCPIPSVGTFELRAVPLGIKAAGESLSAEAALLLGAYNATLGEKAIKRSRTARSRIAHRAISMANIAVARCYLHSKTCGTSLLVGVVILAQTKAANVGTTEKYIRFDDIPEKEAAHAVLLVILLKLISLHLCHCRIVLYGGSELRAALEQATGTEALGEEEGIGKILARSVKLFPSIEFGTNKEKSEQVAAKVRALAEYDGGGEIVETDFPMWKEIMAHAIEVYSNRTAAYLTPDLSAFDDLG
jgi:hypothetical protein